MTARIILEGISLEEHIELMRQIIREELGKKEKVRQITKKEACDELHINFRTLQRIMEREGMTKIYNTDIPRIKEEYPKYSR